MTAVKTDDERKRSEVWGVTGREIPRVALGARLGEDLVEPGLFEIPAGGRRFQALSLLVKQKRLGKTAPIPCIERDAVSDISDRLVDTCAL